MHFQKHWHSLVNCWVKIALVNYFRYFILFHRSVWIVLFKIFNGVCIHKVITYFGIKIVANVSTSFPCHVTTVLSEQDRGRFYLEVCYFYCESNHLKKRNQIEFSHSRVLIHFCCSCFFFVFIYIFNVGFNQKKYILTFSAHFAKFSNIFFL